MWHQRRRAVSTNCETITLTFVEIDRSNEGSRWVHTPNKHAEWIISRLLTKVAVVEYHKGQCAGCGLPNLMSYIVFACRNTVRAPRLVWIVSEVMLGDNI